MNAHHEELPPSAFSRGLPDETGQSNAATGTTTDLVRRATDALVDRVDVLLPRLENGLDHAQGLIDRGMLAVLDASEALSAKAREVASQATAYTQREPAHALLVAAAAGAGLVALLGLLGRRRD